MSVFSITEAAELLGVSADSLCHCAQAGQLAITATPSGQCAVDGTELARFANTLNTAPRKPLARSQVSTRNEFPAWSPESSETTSWPRWRSSPDRTGSSR